MYSYFVSAKADGTLDKYKSRCCLQGNWMEKGKDFAESFSVGSRITSVKLIFAITVRGSGEGWASARYYESITCHSR